MYYYIIFDLDDDVQKLVNDYLHESVYFMTSNDFSCIFSKTVLPHHACYCSQSLIFWMDCPILKLQCPMIK